MYLVIEITQTLQITNFTHWPLNFGKYTDIWVPFLYFRGIILIPKLFMFMKKIVIWFKIVFLNQEKSHFGSFYSWKWSMHSQCNLQFLFRTPYEIIHVCLFFREIDFSKKTSFWVQLFTKLTYFYCWFNKTLAIYFIPYYSSQFQFQKRTE